MTSADSTAGIGRRGGDRSPLVAFFLLVVALSVPLWVIGQVTDLSLVPGLPLAALQAFCPVVAAVIVVGWTSGRSSVRALLRRAVDYRRTRDRRWFLLALLLMPAVMLVGWATLPITGTALPSPEFSIPYEVVIVAAFFIAAEGEELGWSGFATEPMMAGWGALGAGLGLGCFWASWHVVPDLQAGRSLSWVLWQFVGTVALRVIMVWLYNGSGKSVFSVVVFHTMINVSEFPFPNYGPLYDPVVPTLVLAGLAVVVALLYVRRRRESERVPGGRSRQFLK